MFTTVLLLFDWNCEEDHYDYDGHEQSIFFIMFNLFSSPSSGSEYLYDPLPMGYGKIPHQAVIEKYIWYYQ